MMRELKNIDEATGRTVQAIVLSRISRQMVIVFTDDCFITFEADHDDYTDRIVFGSLDPIGFGFELIQVGVINEAELADIAARNKEKRQQERREAEYKHYLALKQQFEGHGRGTWP